MGSKNRPPRKLPDRTVHSTNTPSVNQKNKADKCTLRVCPQSIKMRSKKTDSESASDVHWHWRAPWYVLVGPFRRGVHARDASAPQAASAPLTVTGWHTEASSNLKPRRDETVIGPTPSPSRGRWPCTVMGLFNFNLSSIVEDTFSMRGVRVRRLRPSSSVQLEGLRLCIFPFGPLEPPGRLLVDSTNFG
jgi:hypothetical protein